MTRGIKPEHIAEKIDAINALAGRTVVRSYDESRMWTISVYKDFQDPNQYPDATHVDNIGGTSAFLDGIHNALHLLMPSDPQKIREALERTDWALLAQQKVEVVEQIGRLEADVEMLRSRPTGPGDAKDADDREAEAGRLTGVLHFLDAVQDAAELDGYPVVFLTEDCDEK